MADKKVKSVVDAAEQGRRKGQQTRAELLEENKALKEKVEYLSDQCSYLDVQRKEISGDADWSRKKYYEMRTSRDAWILKCEELFGNVEELTGECYKLKELSSGYLREYYDLEDKYKEVVAHPWSNLLRYLKKLVGLGK